jgi:hypothetical protein
MMVFLLYDGEYNLFLLYMYDGVPPKFLIWHVPPWYPHFRG